MLRRAERLVLAVLAMICFVFGVTGIALLWLSNP